VIGRATLRSHALRLAVVHAVLFGLCVTVLLGFLYWATAGFLASEADATINAELAGLAEQYRSQGLEGLGRVVAERMRRDPGGDAVYLFADARFRPLGGNLNAWPIAQSDDRGWIDFIRRTAAGERPTRARVFLIEGRVRLLVGRDMRSLREVRTLVLRAIAWGAALSVLLAALLGLATSRASIRRIESINLTSRDIMAGDLGRRVPTDGSGDEFDRLAENLNAMLDEIESLMASVREVSDSVAHDLRTPLTRLKSRLEELGSSVEGEEASRLAAEAMSDADQMLAAFTALLRIARLEAGGAERRFEAVDLGTLADDAFELYDVAAQSQGIELRRRVADADTVDADRDLLFQAVCNLLDNAIKFTPDGGVVTLEVARRDGLTCLAVADSGPGVPVEVRDRIFRRFFRAEASRSTPGHGLGLSLVAAVARHHQATVETYDNAPGLTVELRFPARC
jgi:signal transduction histidine kinase